jgi:hypothetical protein
MTAGYGRIDTRPVLRFCPDEQPKSGVNEGTAGTGCSVERFKEHGSSRKLPASKGVEASLSISASR